MKTLIFAAIAASTALAAMGPAQAAQGCGLRPPLFCRVSKVFGRCTYPMMTPFQLRRLPLGIISAVGSR